MSSVPDFIQEIQRKINNIQIKADGTNRYSIELTEPSKIKDLAKLLQNSGFDHVISVSGVDYPEQEKLGVVYHISSYEEGKMNIVLTLKTYVTYKEPVIDSLISIWPSAWTAERETFEDYGIIFKGHDELRLFFLPEDFDGVYPLRKSFKIKTEGIFVDRRG
ncbi:NADH-quinone oxidoreductase subunit C [Sulfolobales archaeon HS-7]|nr:NADH-quinone oxidoreductase subunit C [Sulfolobales archaeon HS-7]